MICKTNMGNVSLIMSVCLGLQKITSKVELKDNATAPVHIRYFSSCKGGPEVETSVCDNLHVGDQVRIECRRVTVYNGKSCVKYGSFAPDTVIVISFPVCPLLIVAHSTSVGKRVSSIIYFTAFRGF